jgi:lysophospholipase L1-like esterase
MRFLPRALVAFSLVAAAALVAGVAGALRPAGDPVPPAPAAASPPAPGSGRLLLALGDSLTRGTGDPGGGYVPALAAALAPTRPGLRVENLAVDGLESEGLLETLSHPHARELVASAGMIVLSIGGNDLTHSLPRVLTGESGVDAARRAFAANVERIFAQLRAGNPSAPVFALLLYNPYPDARAAGSEALIDWNAAIQRAAARHGVRAVPTEDLFDGRRERLSADRFHPSAAGHALIARRILEEL